MLDDRSTERQKVAFLIIFINFRLVLSNTLGASAFETRYVLALHTNLLNKAYTLKTKWFEKNTA